MNENSETLSLIRQASVGQRESMEKLLETTRPRLFSYLMRITMDYHLAEDLLQEVQTEILTNLWRLNNASLFWPWIYKHAWGKAQHHYRDTRRHKTVFLSDVENQFFEEQFAQAENEKSICNDTETEQLFETIYTAMKTISLKQRSILTMRCYEDMSFQEIGDFLECSETNARVLFYRARHRLKKQLRRKGYKAKKMFVPAIGLFGLLTGKTGAGTPAAVGATAGTVEVGFGASLIGFLTTKLGMLTGTVTAALMAWLTLANLMFVGIVTAILIPIIFVFFLTFIFEDGK
jgi:RNA polymerase sigma-70 factor (ECF subfamily)